MVELTVAERAFLESLPRLVHLFADAIAPEERMTLLKFGASGHVDIVFGPMSCMCLATTAKGRAALAGAEQVSA